MMRWLSQKKPGTTLAQQRESAAVAVKTVWTATAAALVSTPLALWGIAAMFGFGGYQVGVVLLVSGAWSIVLGSQTILVKHLWKFGSRRRVQAALARTGMIFTGGTTFVWGILGGTAVALSLSAFFLCLIADVALHWKADLEDGSL